MSALGGAFMKVVTISMFKMAVILSFGLVLLGCTTSGSYDSVYARDRGAENYSAKLLVPTAIKSLDIVIEQQGTRGDGFEYHYPKYAQKYNNQTKRSETTEIRPAITTQDSFAISATSLGVKWNFFDRPRLGMNFYVAVMKVNAKTDISVPAYLAYAPTQEQVKHSSTTLSQELEIYVPITERLRLVSSLMLGPSVNISSHGVEYRATNQITLGLGHKRWNYDEISNTIVDTPLQIDKLNFSSKSNMSLDSSGISGELTYRF